MKTVKFNFNLGDTVDHDGRGIRGKVVNLQLSAAGKSAKVAWLEGGQGVARWFPEDELAAVKPAKKAEV